MKLFSDGGSRSNPGPSALGFVLFDDKDELLLERGEYLGKRTNNEAEYLGLLAGLHAALAYQPSSLECYLDSDLVVKQLNGYYKVKNERMRKLFEEVKKMEKEFNHVSYCHIPREKNRRADKILNEILRDLGY